MIEYHLVCGCGRKKTAEFKSWPWMNKTTVRDLLPQIRAWAADREAGHECKK
jgi:hypothetical protein